MLQGNLSTQDEEDVEDELAALQQEVALPAPPTKEPPKRQPVVEESAGVEADLEPEVETRTALPA